MAQTGYTPISLYYSATAAAAPTSGNLVAGELAINTADGKLFYKDSAGVVQVLATKGAGTVGGANTQVQYNNNGALAGSANFVFDGTNVGIGTSSPTVKLDVVGSTGNFIRYTSNAGISCILGDNSGASGQTGTTTNHPFIFLTDSIERMRIESSGNVGIGTSSPASPLTVYSSNAEMLSLIRNVNVSVSGSAGVNLNFSALVGTTPTIGGSIQGVLSDANNGYLAFRTRISGGISEVMRLDASGNVGIGTASGTRRLNILGSADNNSLISITSSLGTSTAETVIGVTSNDIGFVGTLNSTAFTFRTNNTERMRIDSSGSLRLGTTSAYSYSGSQEKLTVLNASGNAGVFVAGGNTFPTLVVHQNYGSGSQTYLYFVYNGTPTGSIGTNGSTTTYATSSDYRLKENIAPMTGALDKVLTLKPVTYTWKSTGEASEGFIAHELQEVVPDCVTGKKDGTRIEKYEISPAIDAEIDEDGKVIKEAVEAVMGEREVPDYQGVDTSFLVATLTAAIQELNAKVIALEAKVG